MIDWLIVCAGIKLREQTETCGGANLNVFYVYSLLLTDVIKSVRMVSNIYANKWTEKGTKRLHWNSNAYILGESLTKTRLSSVCFVTFLKGQGHQGIFFLVTKKGHQAFVHVLWHEIANLYWIISRAQRQWPGGMEAIAFVASVKYQACSGLDTNGIKIITMIMITE